MAKSYCTEENSVEVVVTQHTNAKTHPIGEVFSILIRHLPAAIKEIELTQDEWMSAIKFLTETRHICDDWRRE